MPAVIVFGRRWACGTDDFVFPGLLDTFVKSCWLVSSLHAYLQMDPGNYENKLTFRIYLFGMMASLILIILTDLLVVNRSAKGSIMDTHLRTIIPTLIYLRLFWEALDTGWNTVGTLWVFGPTFATLHLQDPASFYFIRRYIICNWVSLIVLALFFAFLYDPLGCMKANSEDGTYRTAQSQFWAKKIKNYWKIWSRSQVDAEESYDAAGATVASILKDTNFVSSDASAGLFALFRLEEDRCQAVPFVSSLVDSSKNEKETQISSSPCVQNMDDSEPAAQMEIISEILKMEKYFPFTTVNWVQHVNSKHEHRILKLRDRAKSCGDVSSQRDPEFESNGFCSRCKMSDLRNSITGNGIPESDLIHISLRKTTEDVPFCIFLDHISKSLVLVVIASASSPVLVTYLDVTPIRIDVPGGYIGGSDGFQVHGGLYRISESLKQMSFNVIEELRKTYPTYNLVLIGQSFGAGIAALLGISLHSKIPELKVICLNPPGGLLSTEGSKFTETFITSITFGNDLFSRLSFSSILKLKEEVINVIYKCQTPKYKLLLGIFLRFCGYKLKVSIAESKNRNEGQYAKGYVNQAHTITIPCDDSSCAMEGTSTIVEHKNPKMEQETGLIKMYLPGKILHINKIQTPEDSEQGSSSAEIRIRDAQCETFGKIVTLPGILLHHYKSQDRIMEALRERLKS